jgi:hypothetical protein
VKVATREQRGKKPAMKTLTTTEQLITKATQTRAGWLNCSYVYLCEVFALRAKELIDFREVDRQLQIKARQTE